MIMEFQAIESLVNLSRKEVMKLGRSGLEIRWGKQFSFTTEGNYDFHIPEGGEGYCFANVFDELRPLANEDSTILGSKEDVGDFIVTEISIISDGVPINVPFFWLDGENISCLRFPIWFDDPATGDGVMVSIDDESWNITLTLIPDDTDSMMLVELTRAVIELLVERKKSRN